MIYDSYNESSINFKLKFGVNDKIIGEHLVSSQLNEDGKSFSINFIGEFWSKCNNQALSVVFKDSMGQLNFSFEVINEAILNFKLLSDPSKVTYRFPPRSCKF